MRLDKLLSNLKYGSRKDIAKIAKNHMIKVNGETITDASRHINPKEDEVQIGSEVVHYKASLTLMMHKRQGVLSARKDDKDITVIDDLNPDYQRYDLHIAGRLDKDAEGLLLLTTDGKLLHDIISPQKNVYKTYEVITQDAMPDLSLFKQPMTLTDGKGEPYQIEPPKIILQENQKTVIAIKEGKYHQVKNMFKAIGTKVVFLKRIAIGELQLPKDLALGETKELTQNEIDRIFKK